MSDEEVRALERDWRADPTDVRWVALGRALARAGRPFALELRRAGLRLTTLRPRTGTSPEWASEDALRYTRTIALIFIDRQVRRAARELRRAVEAGLDPREVEWKDVPESLRLLWPNEHRVTGKRDVFVPAWVFEISRNVWFFDRAKRRRPRIDDLCVCGHEGIEHRGEIPRHGFAPGGVEVGPYACRKDPLYNCSCTAFRLAFRENDRTDLRPTPIDYSHSCVHGSIACGSHSCSCACSRCPLPYGLAESSTRE